jgi:hypothetical protein
MMSDFRLLNLVDKDGNEIHSGEQFTPQLLYKVLNGSQYLQDKSVYYAIVLNTDTYINGSGGKHWIACVFELFGQ